MDIETILESLKEGVLILGEKSEILYFNRAYGEFINEELKNIKGRVIKDVRPGAKAPDVIKNGIPIEGGLRKEKGEEYFVNIYPIKKDEKVKGTISIVTSLKNARFIKEKIIELEAREKILNDRLRETNGTRYSFKDICAVSEASRLVVDMAKRVAHHDISVLLEGESGSGKELFAQSIHNESSRRVQPFVAINCAAFNTNMLESELFGYENGAFTGAAKGGKAGLLEVAKGGTVFLDEISEMDNGLQAKLLRVLQEHKIRRIGGLKEVEIDVRIISACNVKLLKYIEEGKFRSDLYYRIAVLPITIPPLRERKEDINFLVQNFLDELGIQHKKKFVITETVLDALCQYEWPGNIRELKNMLEYAALMADHEYIDINCFPERITRGELIDDHHISLEEKVKAFEKAEIERLIQLYGQNVEGKKVVARQLGISLATLYNKLTI